MLEHVSSEELSEWMAYEDVFGPLDGKWRDDLLAAIHEEFQAYMYMYAGFKTPKKKKNPVSEPKRITRPWETAKDGEAG